MLSLPIDFQFLIIIVLHYINQIQIKLRKKDFIAFKGFNSILFYSHVTQNKNLHQK